MKFGTITSRRCRRCGRVGVTPLPNSPDQQAANTHRLCAGCHEWQRKNPKAVIK